MATKTVEELYNQVVRRLPVKERLQLAALILNGVIPAFVEESEAWSEEDLRDLTRASLEYAAQARWCQAQVLQSNTPSPISSSLGPLGLSRVGRCAGVQVGRERLSRGKASSGSALLTESRAAARG
jgi:hypothetical protein